MKFKRTIQSKIEKCLFGGKVIVIYGARRVGKTTLVREIEAKHANIALYLNADQPDVRESLTNKTSTELKEYVGRYTLVVIDEAQRVQNIGVTLKLLVDNYPAIQVIATGSSSFDLSNIVVEPLTGRKYEFTLYPLSVEELAQAYQRIDLSRLLETHLLYGSYPEIITATEAKERLIRDIADSYLYKDILEYQQVKSSATVQSLLEALALQVGNEVSYVELANLLHIDKNTVSRYVDLLEQAFVIFHMRPLSRNLRKELGKLRKIYFYDLGIRNALIRSFNPLSHRTDTGAVWENYIISERVKWNGNHGRDPLRYFWRTYDQQEIDYIEEEGGSFSASEIKWTKARKKAPKAWRDGYPGASWNVITKDNYLNYLLPK